MLSVENGLGTGLVGTKLFPDGWSAIGRDTGILSLNIEAGAGSLGQLGRGRSVIRRRDFWIWGFHMQSLCGA